jgi:hypothetical protein
MRLLFRAVKEDDGNLVDIAIVVVNEYVKLSLSPRRVVRCMGTKVLNSSIGQLLNVVKGDYSDAAECFRTYVKADNALVGRPSFH